MPVRPRGRGRAEPSRSSERSVETVLVGRALVGGRLQPLEVGIDGEGRIARLGRDVRGAERHDFGDRVILPAATDLHVHFRDPGGPEAADSFETGSLQAALGGVAAVVDMPNTRPPVTDVDRLEAKAGRAHGRLAVDLILFAAALEPASVPGLARRAGGFKLFLSPTSGIDEVPAPAARAALLSAVAASGLPLTVHAEDPGGFRALREVRSTLDWDQVRPPEAELAAIDGLLPGPPALRLNVAHVTTPEAIPLLERARVGFEATAHHLLLCADRSTDPRRKVNPPLREEAARAGLWEAFRAGRVPFLASDHAPHLAGEKSRPIPEAPSGMPGVETTLPLLLAKVRAGELDPGVLLRAACDRPARFLGLDHGRVAVGHRANLLVVDFRERRRIAAATLHAPCRWSAFEGREAVFPTDHFRDGVRIVEAGEYVGRRDGRLLRPEYARERPGPVGNG